MHLVDICCTIFFVFLRLPRIIFFLFFFLTNRKAASLANCQNSNHDVRERTRSFGITKNTAFFGYDGYTFYTFLVKQSQRSFTVFKTNTPLIFNNYDNRKLLLIYLLSNTLNLVLLYIELSTHANSLHWNSCFAAHRLVARCILGC